MKVEVDKKPDFLTEKFSFSKIMCFAQCPRKAFYRYVMKRREYGEWLVYGRAVHAGQEWDNLERLKGVRSPRHDVLDAAVAAFEDEATEEVAEGKDRFAEEHDVQLARYWESGERDRLQPVPVSEERPEGGIEAPFEFDLEVLDEEKMVPVTFEGFVDLLAQEDEEAPLEVVDYKSTKRAVGRDEAEKSLQLMGYQLGAEAERGVIVSFIRRGRQRSTARVVEISGLTQRKMQKLLIFLADNVASFRQSVRTGDWPKCSPTCYWCSRSACGFYDECYPSDSGVVAQFVSVGEVRKVGTLPIPEWRKAR